MSPEVLETWNIVLETAGLEGAMAEIALPGELRERDWTPFKVWFVDAENLRGRKFFITISPETGELIQWSEYTSSGRKEKPNRDEEEVRKRIEDLATRLLPPATERKLVRGPEYIERNGHWFAAWKRTMGGIPFELDGCSIEVADEDLSLRGYSVHYYSIPPADMSAGIDVEEAKRLATEAMVDLQKRKMQAQRESPEARERGLDERPLPEVKADVCLEPELRIVPYDPGYFELERSRDARNVRAEMRLAWEVKMNVLVAREDDCWNVYGDKLWIDASTGEVVGGDHLRCLKEYCPTGDEVVPADAGCWW